MQSESAPRGVTSFDHTADVGLEVTAPSLPQLFVRAALGTAWLIRGEHPTAAVGPEGTERRLRLSADDVAALLRAWLRELIYWQETERVCFRAARFDAIDERSLEASVTVAPEATEPVREIKGVTLHGLVAERRGGAWTARVIFDV
jgi:SHS2 domain-containing protein